MRAQAILAALTLVIAACGTASETAATAESEPTTTIRPDTTTSAGATTTSAAATTTSAAVEATTSTPSPSGAHFVLTSVSLGDGGMIVITNVGDATGNLAGHFLCQRPAYFAIPDVEVPPGQFVAISTGGTVFQPPPDAITIDQVATIGTLSPGDGEVGLYDSGNFGASTDILSYVEWGSSGHGRSSVAVKAGIWSDGFVQTADDSVSISANTLPAIEAAHWDVG
ncbi:MAG: hypothetical protein O6923_04480 [Actinobacteria bacterium]|nr:hypothetical protein [Actinomycetota bacterium]